MTIQKYETYQKEAARDNKPSEEELAYLEELGVHVDNLIILTDVEAKRAEACGRNCCKRRYEKIKARLEVAIQKYHDERTKLRVE